MYDLNSIFQNETDDITPDRTRDRLLPVVEHETEHVENNLVACDTNVSFDRIVTESNLTTGNKRITLPDIREYFNHNVLPPRWSRMPDENEIVFVKIDSHFQIKFLIQITNVMAVNVRKNYFTTY